MTSARHLQAVPVSGFDGEMTPDNFRLLLARVRDLEVLEDKLQGELTGKRLLIGKLEADHEQDALDSPERPQVEALHACWKKATKRRRGLDFQDRERMGRAVKKLGFETCLTAIAGAAYDPNTRMRRNGTLERYDDLELIFRQPAKAVDFARRAPVGWKPTAEKVAAIANVPVERVRTWLGEAE